MRHHDRFAIIICMRLFFFLTLFAFASPISHAQDALQQLLAAERGLAKATAEIGIKDAGLQFFAPDAVIFRPEAINALDFLRSRPEEVITATRSLAGAGVSANGQIGFTTGEVETFADGRSKPPTDFGQYATIWGRREGDTWRPILEMAIRHEKGIETKWNGDAPRAPRMDINKRKRSAADSTMYFLRMSMGSAKLGGAYKRYSSNDIRFLRDGLPPLIGKKAVAEFTKDYVAVQFPIKITMIESGDMAYSWNPCQFTNEEGMEKGNCLHVWRLVDKKWWIVLAVFSKTKSETPPELRMKNRARI